MRGIVPNTSQAFSFLISEAAAAISAVVFFSLTNKEMDSV